MDENTSFSNDLIRVFVDALKLSSDLFRIMVPVIITVKVLQEFDLIKYLAIPLGPVMRLVGLPPEMGLVWATAMLNNLYGAVIVFLSLVGDTPVTTAQATVLCTMMLVAHNLPVELKIAQISGPRIMFQAVSRSGSALLLGWLLHIVTSRMNLLGHPAIFFVKPQISAAVDDKNWMLWAAGELQNLVSIFFVILGLLLLMHVLEKLKIISAMNRLLRPVLGFMGIGPKASAVTVVGLTMGIAYGGGLIIHEARTGLIPKKDVFYSLTLMGLSHSLIEDTLLMMMIGGHLSGLIWARLVFSIIAVAFVVKVSKRLPRALSDRFLWGEPQ